jgi:hypothetical protein
VIALGLHLNRVIGFDHRPITDCSASTSPSDMASRIDKHAIAAGAGHSAYEPGNTDALIRATDGFR